MRYKIVDQDGYTRRGKCGETYWLDNQWKEALGKGSDLCTDGVLHFYDSPEIAAFMNCAHANQLSPRLFELETDNEIVYDGVKGGCKRARVGKEVSFIVINADQSAEIAIRVALELAGEWDGKDNFRVWAEGWLSGEGRTEAATQAVYPDDDSVAGACAVYTIYAADEAARTDVYAAVRAATYAAEAATYAAEAAGDLHTFSSELTGIIKKVIAARK